MLSNEILILKIILCYARVTYFLLAPEIFFENLSFLEEIILSLLTGELDNGESSLNLASLRACILWGVREPVGEFEDVDSSASLAIGDIGGVFNPLVVDKESAGTLPREMSLTSMQVSGLISFFEDFSVRSRLALIFWL